VTIRGCGSVDGVNLHGIGVNKLLKVGEGVARVGLSRGLVVLRFREGWYGCCGVRPSSLQLVTFCDEFVDRRGVIIILIIAIAPAW